MFENHALILVNNAMSAKKAIDAYSERLLGLGRPRKKNARPEKDLEREILSHMRALGLSVDVIESKATFSKQAGRYLGSSAPSGFPDLCGCVPGGLACFIELKANGKLKTLSHIQHQFLLDKAERGCFAVCVDSIQRFDQIYSEWLRLLNVSKIEAQKYLISMLPEPKKEKLDNFDL